LRNPEVLPDSSGEILAVVAEHAVRIRGKLLLPIPVLLELRAAEKIGVVTLLVRGLEEMGDAALIRADEGRASRRAETHTGAVLHHPFMSDRAVSFGSQRLDRDFVMPRRKPLGIVVPLVQH